MASPDLASMTGWMTEKCLCVCRGAVRLPSKCGPHSHWGCTVNTNGSASFSQSARHWPSDASVIAGQKAAQAACHKEISGQPSTPRRSSAPSPTSLAASSSVTPPFSSALRSRLHWHEPPGDEAREPPLVARTRSRRRPAAASAAGLTRVKAWTINVDHSWRRRPGRSVGSVMRARANPAATAPSRCFGGRTAVSAGLDAAATSSSMATTARSPGTVSPRSRARSVRPMPSWWECTSTGLSRSSLSRPRQRRQDRPAARAVRRPVGAAAVGSEEIGDRHVAQFVRVLAPGRFARGGIGAYGIVEAGAQDGAGRGIQRCLRVWSAGCGLCRGLLLQAGGDGSR